MWVVIAAVAGAVALAGCGDASPVASSTPGSTTTAAATTTSSPEELAAWVDGYCAAIAPLGTIQVSPPAEQIDQTSLSTVLTSLDAYYANAGALVTTAGAAVAELGPVPLAGAQGYADYAVEKLGITADMYEAHRIELAAIDPADQEAVLAYGAQFDATEPIYQYASIMSGPTPALAAAITADPECKIVTS